MMFLKYIFLYLYFFISGFSIGYSVTDIFSMKIDQLSIHEQIYIRCDILKESQENNIIEI